MAVINLSENETKLLNAVIDEMNEMPEVDFNKVAQRVGIKHTRNARTSFKKLWTKLKTPVNGEFAEEGSASESTDKPMTIKAPMLKKTPVKKGIVKSYASESKTAAKKQAARKTKTEKDEKGAAAAADQEAEDETAEQDEDGKSLKFSKALATNINPDESTKSVKFNIDSVQQIASGAIPASNGKGEVSAAVEADAAEIDYLGVQHEPPNYGSTFAEAAMFVSDNVPVMNDEYEAYIRDMPLVAWLKWKRDSGYTFDLLSL